jgi:transposase InsO family protein
MKDNGLTVPRNTALRAKREPKTRKPVTDMPDTVWGTDMTKTRTAQGWAYVHVVLDWGSKKLLALEASPTSRSSDWIRAMDKAVDMQFPCGIDCSDPYLLILSIVSDNGCQPTSKAFAEYEKALGLEHIFTSYCNPKGDADTERVIRTIKEDLLWINEFKTLDELKEALGKWQHDYNHVFPHSSLEYCTPVEYEERWNCGTEPQNTRAKKILRKESLFEPMNQNRGLCNAAP